MNNRLESESFSQQAFHRRLLSEYNTDIRLENYLDYFTLKKLLKRLGSQLLSSSGGGATCISPSKAGGGLLLTCGSGGLYDVDTVGDTGSHLGNTPIITPNYQSPSSMMPFPPMVKRTSSSTHPPAAAAAASTAGSGNAVVLSPNSTLSNLFFQEERQTLIEAFLQRLNQSFRKVCTYITALEVMVKSNMASMRSLSEQQILHHPNPYFVEQIYIQLQSLEHYRFLNLVALQRILTKFLQRCANDSLQLQSTVATMYTRAQQSILASSEFDVRSSILELISIYGIVRQLSYEDAILHLRQYEAKVGLNCARILAPRNTFFFSTMLPSRPRKGQGIRVLAGSTSHRMTKALCTILRCPPSTNAPATTISPCGEISVRLREAVRGRDVFLVQSMVSNKAESPAASMSSSVLELALLAHNAQIAGAKRITAVVPYFAYSRDANSIAVVSEMLESMGCHGIITVDLDVEQAEGAFAIPMKVVSATSEFVRFLTQQLRAEGSSFNDLTIVAPRDIYLKRAKDFADALMREANLNSETQFVSVCTAVRRQFVQSYSPAAPSSPLTDGTTAQSMSAAAAPGYSSDGAAAAAGQAETGSHGRSGSVRSRTVPKSSVIHNHHSLMPSGVWAGSEDGLDCLEATLRSGSEMSGSAAASPATPKPEAGRSTSLPYQQDGTPSSTAVDHPAPLPPSTEADAAALDAIMQSPLFKDRNISFFGIQSALLHQHVGHRSIIRQKISHIVEECEDEESSMQQICLVGDVNDRLCIILDTMIDEAVDLAAVSRCLARHGAKRIIMVATHPIFSGKSLERLKNAPVDLVIVSDTIVQDEALLDSDVAKKLRIVPISPLLALAIEKVHTESKLSMLV